MAQNAAQTSDMDLPRRQLLKQIWFLALPVILTNLMQSLVNVVDVFMVGRLGPVAIAAAGMSNAIRMLVLIMVLSVAAGGMSLIAQAKGGRDPQRMSFVARQAIASGVLLSLVLGSIGLVFAQPLLMLANSGGDPQAVTLGTSYLQIIFLGTPFLVLNIVINRLMQGAGDTLTPLLLTGSLNFMNIGFNYVFMFGLGPIPAFGIAGAAMGTVLARFLGVVIALIIIYSGRNVVKILAGSWLPDRQMVTDILTIGVPSGVQGVFRNGSRLLVISIVTSTEVGTLGAAAVAIGFQIESLVFMPGLGINVAATSLVGQSLGRWQPDEARRRGTFAILMGLVMMSVFTVPLIVFAPQIIQLFDPSAQPVLLAAGTDYLRIATLALPLSAIAIVANGALRGAGDSVPGMMSTLVTRGASTVALAWVLAIALDFGSRGVWAAIAIGVVLDAIFMGLRWRSGAWMRVALEKSAVYRQHLKHLAAETVQRYLREVRAPYMAQPGALELVDANGVTYRIGERKIGVQFSPNNYKVQHISAKPN